MIAARMINNITTKNDLIFVSTNTNTPSEILYYSDRKGWYVSYRDITIADIESIREKGARYFVCTPIDRLPEKILKYLNNNYKLIQNNSTSATWKFNCRGMAKVEEKYGVKYDSSN